MISKAKNPDRQRALVLVVCKGAVPATLMCDALLFGVARQRTPYICDLGSRNNQGRSLKASLQFFYNKIGRAVFVGNMRA